jgi:hypothetical protein
MCKTALVAITAAVFAACATGSGGAVDVKKTGVTASPKAAGCTLEVLQKRPTRPYESLGELTSHVTVVPKEGSLSVVKPTACELGADAIIVNNNMVLNEVGHVLVAVTAIRWTGEAPAAPPAAVPQPSPGTPGTQPPAQPEASSVPAAPSAPGTSSEPATPPEPTTPREPKR